MDEQIKTCECGEKCECFKKWAQPKYVFITLAILAITAIVIVSILRDRIVNQHQNQVSVTGQGKVSYQPDMATVTLGVQVDRAATAEAALQQLNEKMNNVVAAVETLGIGKENIKTQTYSLSTQYDYTNNMTRVAGYNANQKLSIKVLNIQEDKEMVNKVISAASAAGTNQIDSIDFSLLNINDLKQQARILAIKDAKAKSAGLANAAGVKLGKIEGWYENVIYPVDERMNAGYGGSDMMLSSVKAMPSPQVPSGTQDIIIEVSLNYEVK